jgi:hypothetical protein
MIHHRDPPGTSDHNLSRDSSPGSGSDRWCSTLDPAQAEPRHRRRELHGTSSGISTWAICTLIRSVNYDVLELSINEKVQDPDDAGFTNFLNASEDTFEYSIGSREQEIIDIFRDYQSTHPYVNSVYMGRENGAFVRAYPQARPSQYDPRDRPWYTLAASHPGQVSMTEPCRSVTTPDVNIGLATPLLHENGTLYGVVGADITLANLTDYISEFNMAHRDEMILTDRSGIILAARDSSFLFGNVSEILEEQTTTFLGSPDGRPRPGRIVPDIHNLAGTWLEDRFFCPVRKHRRRDQ